MFLTITKSSKSLNKEKEKLTKYLINNDLSPFSNNNLLTIPQQNKNKLCLTPHGRNNTTKNKYYSSFNLPENNNNNISIMQKSINIREKIEQYKLHPFRPLNLKLVEEDIKQKLIEMNEISERYENEKTISSPTESIKKTNELRKQYSIKINNSNDNIINLNLSYNNENDKKGNSMNDIQMPNLDIFEKNDEIHENDKNNICHTLKIKIPKIQIKKIDNENKETENDNQKNNNIPESKGIKTIKSLNSKIAAKYRKLIKIKNIYDSMEDNESEEDEGDAINPETKPILIFDSLIIILYLYSFFILTMNLAQTKCFCSSNHCDFNDIIFYFIDLLYILDLIISFCRSFYNFEFKLIKQNNLVIKNYLTGDFFLDFLEAIPIFTINKYICYKNIQYFHCYRYEMSSIFFFIKSFSVIKVLKIIKILGRKKNQALDSFLELISENYAVERAALLIIDSFIFIGIIHCFVCFHIFLGNHSYSNWLVKTNAEKESIFNLYIESLYFLVTTLTTVGYGDITCSSFGERIFQIILLAVGSIFYSYIISTIGNYIKNDSHAKIKFNDDLNILENIRIAYPNMKFKLYKNIHKYLESKSSSQEKYDVNSLIEALPFTLKNTILFTMYKSVIKNFKFFKKNNNSEFIAQVLNNFIPVMSKKNEFLVYEGELMEEVIFIKDGRISLNAAINLEDPIMSINKYFNEKFTPFTSDEETKLNESPINNKSGYISAMNVDITYDTAKSRINNAFKTLKNKNSEEKSMFALNNNNEEKNEASENFKFDVNGGAIKNEEGNYQYLKIIDIRKNEHFGCVFMTLKKPCPLSLQVKSKYAELYFLKKDEAIETSKNYPNIWKKLYGKEFHNLRSIKKLTFKALKKYMELNQLLFDLNLEKAISKNELTINDLNELEKSLYTDKSIVTNPLFKRSQKTIKKVIPNNDITKFKTMNSEFDKKAKRLSLSKINIQNHKNNLPLLKNKFKGGYTLSNSIICSNSNKDKIFQLSNNNIPFIQNNKIKGPKLVHFADEIKIFNKNGKTFNDKNELLKKLSSNELYSDNNEGVKKVKVYHNKTKKEKLKKLKNFLINCKKKLKLNKKEKKGNLKHKQNENNNNNNNNNNNKPDTYQINLKTDNQLNKNVEQNNIKNNNETISNNYVSNNLNNYEKSLFNDLKNYCNEESNFSFCSTDGNNCNFEHLSISNDINLEILSSYSNLNQISKGKYISNLKIQKKIKNKIRKYFIIENSKNEFSLSLKSLEFFSDSKGSIRIKKDKPKNKSKKEVKINKSSKSHKNVIKSKKPEYEESIKNKAKSQSNNKQNFKNDIINHSNKNNKTSFNKSLKNNMEQDSKKVNIDSNNNENNFSFTKKNSQYDDSFKVDIKKNKQVYSHSEAEFEIDQILKKTSINNKNNPINNNNNIDNNNNNNNNNYTNIYKNNIHKKKYIINKNKKNNEQRKIINQILGIQLPNTNIITNNITTSSSNQFDNKDNFNTREKINNIEASFSIYNIIQKNINKNLNIIDGKEKNEEKNLNKSICKIF